MMGFVCCLALDPVLSFWGWTARPEVMGWEDPGKSVGHHWNWPPSYFPEN